jgi:hypothetical protein
MIGRADIEGSKRLYIETNGGGFSWSAFLGLPPPLPLPPPPPNSDREIFVTSGDRNSK